MLSKDSMKVAAIIPARKGSKRLPRKNTRPFLDKPLVEWTIDAALKSSFIDIVIVSSDDEDVLQLAASKKSHKEIICLSRDENLSSDSATSRDVIIDAVEKNKALFDYFVLLQPTSPLRNEVHIDQAFEVLIEKKASVVVSLCECEHSPLWSNELPESHSLEGFVRADVQNKRSQELKTYYRLNGAIYISEVYQFKLTGSFFSPNAFGYVMDASDSIDIDKLVDFISAEAVMKYKINGSLVNPLS